VDTLLNVGLSNAALAGVLALAVTAAGPLLRRRPALAHGLWLLVLLKLLTPPLLAVPLPVLTGEEGGSIAGGERGRVSAPSGERGRVSAPSGEWGRVSAQSAELDAPGTPGAYAPGAPKRGSRTQPRSSAFLSWQQVVLALWLAGSLLWFALAAWRIARFRRLLRLAELAPAEVQEQAGRLARHLGLARCPAIRLALVAVSPLVWSLGRRACLLLPASLWAQLSEGQREALLVHELAHLRRRDHWVRWFELFVVGLYWWHPAVWWARRQLHEAEEQCCDAWVMWALPESGPSYAAALVETVAFLSRSRAALPVAASGAGQVRTLKRRLTMILRNRPSRSLSVPGLLAMAGLAALLLPLVPSWAGPAADDPPSSEQRPKAKNEAQKPAPARGVVVTDTLKGGRRVVPPQKAPPQASASSSQQLRDDIELLEVQVQIKRAEVAAAQLKLKEVRTKLRRYERLAKTNAISQQEVEDAQAKAATAEAQVRVKEAELREPEVRLRQARQRLERLQRGGSAAPQGSNVLPGVPGLKPETAPTILRFTPGSLNLGSVPHGSILSRKVLMVNTSKMPVKITAVRTSAGTVTAWAQPTQLGPGQKGFLMITIHTGRFSGPKAFEVQVTGSGPHGQVTRTINVFAASQDDGPGGQIADPKRLQELEKKLDALQKEIDSLRKQLPQRQFSSGPGKATSPDKRLVAVGEGKAIVIYDAATQKILRKMLGHTGRATALAFSPDGKLLAVGSGSSATLWDLTTGREILLIRRPVEVVGVSFSDDGRILQVTDRSGGTNTYGVATGQAVGQVQTK
jgi:beta-lactamase regulating signal transducer with metallopeptidase domain